MMIESNNKNGEGAEDFKFYMGEDNIIRINTGKKKWDMKTIEVFAEKFIDFAKKLSKDSEAKVLIDINLTPPTPTSVFRKKIVSMMMHIFKNIGVKRVAIWGGSKVIKVVTAFFLMAANIDSVKYFNTEKDALEWLNK